LIKAHLIVGFGALLAGVSCTALAQSNPNNSAQNPYVGSVQAVAPTPTVMPLSMDDAIRLGIENNLALVLARENQKVAHAEKLQIINYLTPNLTLHGETGVHQYDLAAEGFHQADLSAFAGLLPPGTSASSIPLITKVDVTNGQLNLNQELFSWAGWDAWRAAKANVQATNYNAASSRGLVVLNVGNLYLEALAARTQVDMAKALLASDQRALYDAHQQHLAGTAANLDELRARVQAQAQQQAVLQAQDDFEKAKIALNRAIGLAPEQKLQLTDASPYANLVAMSIEDARQQAYANRQDFQTLKAQIRAAEFERRATVHERLPSLSFSGDYGVTGISGGIYHGTFGAVGNLSIPIFQEAKFRSDRDVAEAQLNELRSQLEDLKQKIDQQLRDSLLDLQTAGQLIRVSRSNLDLANTALEQTNERAQAGIDTNLPVVEAQATVAQAQTQYVQSVLQFNEAKLGLARNLGIIDTQYRTYLTGGNPPQIHSNQAATQGP
jgi:outer membrane protein TolC